jgi:hypothetical protein
MERILSGRCGASKVVDAAISDAQLWYGLLKTLPTAMTSREKSQQNGTAINATGGTDSRLAALRSLANRDKLRFKSLDQCLC